MCASRPGECGGVIANFANDVVGTHQRGQPSILAITLWLNENVGGLEKFGSPESINAGFVIAPALILGWRCRLDFSLKEGPNQCILLDLRATGLVVQRFHREARPPGLLQEQLTHGKRPGRFDPGGLGVRRRVMLDFLGDSFRRDLDTVDAHFTKARRRRKHGFWTSAAAARLA